MNTVYFDNAATSFPKPEKVYETMHRFIQTAGANPGRAGHRMAVEAEQAIEQTRILLAKLFGLSAPERLVFTLNATDALNMGIKGILRKGDHAITSVLEHNSVSRPLERLVDEGWITLTRLPCDAEGFLSSDKVQKALRKETRLVVLTHASNVLGTVQPIREIGRMLSDTKAYFMVDAAQTAGILPIDVEADNIDVLAFPGHKALLGPPGSGGLYVRDCVQLEPWREGGTGGDSATRLQPESFPFFLEGGTPNTLGIVGLGTGVRFILDTGLTKIEHHERSLRQKLVDGLRNDHRFTLYGPLKGEETVSTLSINVQDIRPEEVGAILDQSFNIAVRSGLHCAPYLHKELGTFPDGTVRISLGFFNTEEEVEGCLNALQQIAS